jgi:hypothetical protein
MLLTHRFRDLRPAARWALVAALALLAAACGKNRVLLDVDVLSFMDESSLVHPYDAPPLVPFTARLDSIAVNLVEGFQDFGEAQSATLDVGVEYDNATGQGSGRFTIYFSDDPGTTFSTPPVAVLDVDLLPGTVSTASIEIPADARVLDLFTSKRFWMGVDMEWNPTGVDPLQGTLRITEIRVHLVSTLDIF